MGVFSTVALSILDGSTCPIATAQHAAGLEVLHSSLSLMCPHLRSVGIIIRIFIGAVILGQELSVQNAALRCTCSTTYRAMRYRLQLARYMSPACRSQKLVSTFLSRRRLHGMSFLKMASLVTMDLRRPLVRRWINGQKRTNLRLHKTVI